MNLEAGLPGLSLFTPADGLAEGEIDPTADLSDGHQEMNAFANRLIEACLPASEWRLSAFSIDWSGLTPAGQLYGQAWLERAGTSVSFARFRLCDSGGRLVAAGSATAHNADPT